MLQKHELIVLRITAYGESSLVVKAFSRTKGVLSFITSVSRKSKSGLKKSLFQVLNILEVVYYEKSKGDLKRIKEAKLNHHYLNLPIDPIKSCTTLFLAEVLQHLLHESDVHPELYDYIKHSLMYLDEREESIANFHLVFLMNLTDLLGFAPASHENVKEKMFFDLLEGSYVKKEVPHSYYLKGEALKNWNQLQNVSLKNSHLLSLTGKSRATLLQNLLDYIRLHVSDFGELKSLKILREILH